MNFQIAYTQTFYDVMQSINLRSRKIELTSTNIFLEKWEIVAKCFINL